MAAEAVASAAEKAGGALVGMCMGWRLPGASAAWCRRTLFTTILSSLLTNFTIAWVAAAVQYRADKAAAEAAGHPPPPDTTFRTALTLSLVMLVIGLALLFLVVPAAGRALRSGAGFA